VTGATGTELRTYARFPAAAAGAGRYESFYLKLSNAAERVGAWIRYTAHKRPNAPPKGSLWFTLFEASGPSASKVTVEGPTVGPERYITVGDATLEPGRACGSVASESLEAAWDLSFTEGEPPLDHFPREWMYRAPVPRTKVTSPYPAISFNGTITVGERRIDVDGWPGMMGHNWGSEHAERSIWMEGRRFEGHDAWLDVAIGRVKLGPMTTPWVANGVLSLDGRRHRLGGAERIHSTKIAETPERCEFVLPGPGLRVEGTIGAPRERFVGWIYADPDGGEHQTVNCSIADVELRVSRRGEAPLEIVAPAAGAYELGMRERYEPIPVQPFADG
jgi:hypothetical protein